MLPGPWEGLLFLIKRRRVLKEGARREDTTNFHFELRRLTPWSSFSVRTLSLIVKGCFKGDFLIVCVFLN